VIVDVGTGDGRAVLAAATREPTTLVIGLDPDAGSMAEASRRAAARPQRGGRSNAIFVIAAAGSMPCELAGRADLVTVTLPWGSLLRGCVGLDPDVARGIASLLAADGELELTLAPTNRDRLDDMPTDPEAIAGAVGRAFGDAGLALLEADQIPVAAVAATGSTWAKRLRADPERRAMRLRLRRRAVTIGS